MRVRAGVGVGVCAGVRVRGEQCCVKGETEERLHERRGGGSLGQRLGYIRLQIRITNQNQNQNQNQNGWPVLHQFMMNELHNSMK